MADPEILALLAEEAEFLQAELQNLIAEFSERRDNPAAILESLERLTEAANTLGLTRIQLLKNWIAENLLAISTGRAKELDGTTIRRLLVNWLNTLVAICKTPGDPAARDAFVASMRRPEWPTPIPEKRLQGVLGELSVVTATDLEPVAEGEEAATTLDTQAYPPPRSRGGTPIDLSPSAECDPRLWDAYLDETPGMAENLIQMIRTRQGFVSDEDTHHAERLAHTVKGSSSLVGVEPIRRLALALEDVFEFLAGRRPEPPLAELLLNAADLLEMQFSAIGKPQAPSLCEPSAIVAELERWAASLQEDAEGESTDDGFQIDTFTVFPPDGEEPGWTSLQVAGDVDPSLLDAFFQETPDQAATLAYQLRSAADGELGGPQLMETQRLAHTVKGSCALVGLSGIERLAHRLEDVLELLGEAAPPPELATLFTEVGDAIEELFDRVIDRAPRAQIDSESLIGRLQKWVKRLSGGGAGHQGVAVPPPPSEELAPEDLLWDETVAASLLDTFFAEAPEQAQRLATLLRERQVRNNKQRDEAGALASAIKLSAKSVGIHPLEQVAEHLEKILEVFGGDGVPEQELERLVNAAQLLDELLGSIQGMLEAPSDLGHRISELGSWAQRLDRTARIPGAVSTPSPSMAPAAKAPADHQQVATPSATSETTEQQITSSIRVPTARIDALMRLVGEMTTTVAQMHGRLQGVHDLISRIHRQGTITRRRVADLETVVEVQGVPALSLAGDEAESGFDPLEMDSYHELHGIVSAFTESFADNQELSRLAEEHLQQLAAISHNQQRLSRDINEAVLATRMFPLNVLTARLERTVREACRASGKKAELIIEGDELLADTDIINGLRDALMHLLRNSVDHGIETPEERLARRKPEGGEIRVRYLRQGNTILVRVRDDGGGFNIDKIRATAQKNGIKLDQALGEPELLRLVLLPGFSTKGDVTRLSGRGIGMDVVRQAVEELKGSVILRNGDNGGADMTLRLPLTLVSAPVLLVRVQQQTFAIPGDDVDQILYREPAAISNLAEGWSFHHGDSYFPLRALNTLLGRQPEAEAIGEQQHGSVLLVHDDLGQQAVLVDVALERRDVVVLSLGPWLPEVHGVSGACILADGSVAPVLDLRVLLREGSAMQAMERTIFGQTMTAQGREGLEYTTIDSQPRILIVDDSLSARRALEIALEQGGYEVVSAIDGFDAIRVLDEERPNLILVDMEMPRMNGLEFTQHVRAQPETHQLPVVMVTSRSTAKHRDQARRAGVDEYLTKPFDNDHLFATINSLLAAKARGGARA